MALAGIIDSVRKKYQAASEYDVPIYRIEVDGIDISKHLKNRLRSLKITDHRGLIADSLDIELSDTDGLLDIPPERAEIKAWIGWQSTGLVYKGSYQVTATSHSGPPDKITISAEAADLADSFKQKREKSWHQVSIQDIISTVAAQYELNPLVHSDLASHPIEHIDQNESDANLITRLADEYDAIATVKNGNLLFMPRGSAQSASGLELPIMYIRRNDGDGHSYRSGDGTDRIDAVKAFYYDTDRAVKKKVIVGIIEAGNIKELRYTCRDKSSAELAANAEFNRCKRAAKTFSTNLSRGNPNLIPEQQIIVEGFKPQIDEIIWLGTTVTHTLDASGGYTTSLECEIQLPDSDDISQLFDGSIEKEDKDYENYTGVKATYIDKAGKEQSILLGDQAKPLVMPKPYASKATAETAVYREYNRILATQDKPPIEKPKATTNSSKTSGNKKNYARYTGVKAFYKDKNNKQQTITQGNQAQPLVLSHIYVSKKTAETAAKREYNKIQNARK